MPAGRTVIRKSAAALYTAVVGTRKRFYRRKERATVAHGLMGGGVDQSQRRRTGASSMNTIENRTERPITDSTATAVELGNIKARQRAMWASGDFGIIGTTLQIVGESLCEAVDLRAGSKVLDVAAGNGVCSLAAARRWCDVTSTDYVPALLESGRRRAEAERLPIQFQEADVEALPFGDGTFDVVLSTFGVMF